MASTHNRLYGERSFQPYTGREHKGLVISTTGHDSRLCRYIGDHSVSLYIAWMIVWKLSSSNIRREANPHSRTLYISLRRYNPCLLCLLPKNEFVFWSPWLPAPQPVLRSVVFVELRPWLGHDPTGQRPGYLQHLAAVLFAPQQSRKTSKRYSMVKANLGEAKTRLRKILTESQTEMQRYQPLFARWLFLTWHQCGIFSIGHHQACRLFHL